MGRIPQQLAKIAHMCDNTRTTNEMPPAVCNHPAALWSLEDHSMSVPIVPRKTRRVSTDTVPNTVPLNTKEAASVTALPHSAVEPVVGLEPTTGGLQNRCSTN